MDLVRLLLLLLTLLGAGITIYGLTDAYLGARDQLARARKRVEDLESLEELERRETADRMAAYTATTPRSRAEREAHNAAKRLQDAHRRAQWEDIYERAGLARPTYKNLTAIPVLETQRLFEQVLESTGRDLRIAAVGLVISTVASAASIFLAP